MIEENENGMIDRPNHNFKQRSLLQKYEIPINHLSFEYISSCNDVKELEKIVKVLRSGEEGYYPDLQKSSEDRLHAVSPNNRHLRVEEPVLTRNTMKNDDWNSHMSELNAWKQEISSRDLRLTEENNNSVEDTSLPPVRQLPVSKCVTDKRVNTSASKPKPMSDYTTWNKYDVDEELLKMDLEDEKEKELIKKKQAADKRCQAENDRLALVIKKANTLSDVERKVLAEQEKNRGNEYYQSKDFIEAIKYYTASIAILPSPVAYNNRAACYLKQCKFSAALEDANRTLALDPNNIKAQFRRGIALQHKNKFREALAAMNEVLKQEPKHVLAQHIAEELREQILTLPRTVRIMKDEGMSKPKTIIEMSTKSTIRDRDCGSSFGKNCYEVNEWGLPKIMCQCTGKPKFLQSPPKKCPTDTTTLTTTSHSHFSTRPLPITNTNSAKIVELSDEPDSSKSSTKLEIVEVEKLGYAEEFYKPKKCVIDKRTYKTNSSSVESSLVNKGIKITNGDRNVAGGSGDSGLDLEDFEINPLLDDSSDVLGSV